MILVSTLIWRPLPFISLQKCLIGCFVWRGSGKIKGWDLTLLSADCIFVGSARCLNTWYFLLSVQLAYHQTSIHFNGLAWLATANIHYRCTDYGKQTVQTYSPQYWPSIVHTLPTATICGNFYCRLRLWTEFYHSPKVGLQHGSVLLDWSPTKDIQWRQD